MTMTMKRRVTLPVAIGAVMTLSLTAGGAVASPRAFAAANQTRSAATPLVGCPNMPADSVFHSDVSKLPRHANSQAYINSIGSSKGIKADFGSGTWNGRTIGIPITQVKAGQPRVPVTFEYVGESDRGPYPIPPNALIEGGPNAPGDRHVLVVDTGACKLYELHAAYPNGKGWKAGSGAVFDLRSNKLRPDGWTSADAAGLPIAPLLVRYEEVAAGKIDHAIRMTVSRSQMKHLWPARHHASKRTDAALPPMGLRLRLRSDFNVGALPPQARVIAQAMKTHGVIIADNGSNWYLSGEPDDRWDNRQLSNLGKIKGSDFEAVDASSLMIDPNSAAVRGSGSDTPSDKPEDEPEDKGGCSD
jgi:hypothetical protein